MAADLEPLFEVYSNPLAMRWVGDGRPITLDQCRQWLDITAANYARRGYGMFALEERAAAHAVVGFAGLVHPGGQPEAEVKYALCRSHWGQGLASELLPALLAHGATAHGLQRVIATVAPANLASQRVLSKAGMVHVQSRSNADGSTTLVFEWLAPDAGARNA